VPVEFGRFQKQVKVKTFATGHAVLIGDGCVGGNPPDGHGFLPADSGFSPMQPWREKT
jgi:hypothetical protein